LPLAQKYFTLQVFLRVFLIAHLPKITKESLQEAECLEEEAKVSSLLWLSAFPLELVLLQPLQDHRDGGVETLGLACSAASIRLSQAAFRLLYLSDTSKEEEQIVTRREV
jgi:hypothetical protein